MERVVMRWVAFFICCGLCVVATRAQTTKPAAAWSDQVDKLAHALTHPSDGANFRSAMTEDAVVRGIDGATVQYSQLATSAIGGEIITARGYSIPAGTIASDIASDFSASNSIPDSIRRIMIPAGDKEMRQANDVAGHWMAQMLGAREGERIGVIILRGKASTSQPVEAAEENRSLMMVLIRGDVANGVPQITHMVFGDPRTVMK
jgi:hypothetical protein